MPGEYMLYIRNTGNGKSSLTPEEHLQFVRQCEQYIDELKTGQKLISAQPLEREGCLITKNEQGWNSRPIDVSAEHQVGYYHIVAENMEEAMEIARRNPEFTSVPSASIEIRPVKTKENVTGYIYPGGNK